MGGRQGTTAVSPNGAAVIAHFSRGQDDATASPKRGERRERNWRNRSHGQTSLELKWYPYTNPSTRLAMTFPDMCETPGAAAPFPPPLSPVSGFAEESSEEREAVSRSEVACPERSRRDGGAAGERPAPYPFPKERAYRRAGAAAQMRSRRKQSSISALRIGSQSQNMFARPSACAQLSGGDDDREQFDTERLVCGRTDPGVPGR